MSASSRCPHRDLHFAINHASSGDTNVHYLEILASCNACDAKMLFRGMPWGSSPDRPMASPGNREARLPLIAEGEDLIGSPAGFEIKVDA